MLRCINALEKIDSGEITFDGQSISSAGNKVYGMRADIGMVFQQFNLFPHKSVMQNITLGPTEVKGVSKSEARDRALKLLERVGIPEKADSFPADLVGGPTTACGYRPSSRDGAEVDALRRTDLGPRPRDDPGGTRRHEGSRPQRYDHDRGDPRDGVRGEVCDRIVFIDEGSIVEEGPPEEFFKAARSERARDFVDKIIHH